MSRFHFSGHTVVQFYHWLHFFLLFLGTFEKQENKFKPGKKIESQVTTNTCTRLYCYKSQRLKTESISKLSNINFQWTKTLYQNNLNNIAFFFLHFSRAIDVISYL